MLASWRREDVQRESWAMSRFNTVDVVNAATLEKVVLSQRISGFLTDEHDETERATIVNVARMLAQDISLQVREALAFELRVCKNIPHDLAAKIASDVESVAGPFLATTDAFTDKALAALIPHLEEHAHVTISRRSDLGPTTIEAIVTVGSDKAVSFLIRNPQNTLSETVCTTVMNRFRENEALMRQLSARAELPLSIVEQLVLIVSHDLQEKLVNTYGVSAPAVKEILMSTEAAVIWQQIEQASPQQIHAYAIDLRKAGRVTPQIVAEIVERGCLPFLESILALDVGLTVGAVRETIYSGDLTRYVSLMMKAGIQRKEAQSFLEAIQLRGPDVGWPPSKELH